MGCEDCDLSFKLEDGAMYERFFEEKRRVIGGEASWEVVGAIENSVVRPEDQGNCLARSDLHEG